MRNIKRVIFYSSGDIVRDIGIIYFSEILKAIKVKYELHRNYLEFDYIDPNIISNYILDKLIFKVFKNSKKDELEKKLGDFEKLKCDNYVEKVNESNISEKEKENLKKAFQNRRFPYIRNSGKYGLNCSLENMETNLITLVDIVLKSNISINDISLETFKEEDKVCYICNINKTTKLDINLKEKVDSKLSFLFRGAEKSGFRNNGNSENNICFECEFLNLMCLLYINLERPVIFGYTNDLTELLFINYKLMLKQKLYSDKAFYKKLVHEKINSLKLYDFKIDTNKGIILKFNSIVNYKELIRKIEFIDIINEYNFSREGFTIKNLAKVMVNNNSLTSLKDLLFTNLLIIKTNGTKREFDTVGSSYNLSLYLKTLWIVNKKGEYEMNKYKSKNYVYSQVGRNLSNKMDENKKKNFVFKIVQLLKSNDKKSLFQTIMHTLASYGVAIGDGFVEGILMSNELELNTNVGLFIQELMQYGGNKDE